MFRKGAQIRLMNIDQMKELNIVENDIKYNTSYLPDNNKDKPLKSGTEFQDLYVFIIYKDAIYILGEMKSYTLYIPSYIIDKE